MKRGAVWWVEFDPAQGSEIRKTRPAIIISNDIANEHLARVVVIPITSQIKRLYPGEAKILVAGSVGKAMTDQIMAADKARLKSKLGALSSADMRSVEEALRLHLGMRE